MGLIKYEDEGGMQQDLIEIKSDVKELVKLSAVHNVLLREHEARSLALQSSQEKLAAEMGPVKQHVHFVSLILKGIGLVTVGALIQLVARHFI